VNWAAYGARLRENWGIDMTAKNLAIGAVFAIAALGATCGAAQAATVTVDLGPSSENFTLYGQGQLSGQPAGVGSYTIGQGASTFDGTTSTFILSGTINGSSDPSLASGTYKFVTTYLGADTPEAGPGAPFAQANPANTNQFFYDSFDPSTNMTLELFTSGGEKDIALVTGGNFDGPGFGFGFVSTTCTGVPTCSQALVGLTPGSSISGPVSIGVSFDAVPEPATWAMMLVGFGGLGAAMRSRRKGVAATA
jgi:hypothetical protein